MKFTKTLVSTAAAFVAFTFIVASGSAKAQNADDDWINISSTKDGVKWYGKRNSGMTGTLDKKYKDIIITYKKTSSSSDQIELGVIFTKVSDCKRGEGTIYYGNMDGKATSHDQYVLYGGSVASSLAESLCATLDDITGTKSVRQDAAAMWINAAETNTITFDVKKGSGEIVKEKTGRYAYATEREKYKNQDKIEFEKVSVSEQSCKNGQGEIFYSDVNYGNQYSNNFVTNGGNANSGIAELLCGLFDKKG